MPASSRRPAEIALGANTRRLRSDLRRARGEVRAFGKASAASLRSTLGTAFSAALGLASLGGATAVARDVLRNEEALTRLGIQAGVSDDAVRGLADSIREASLQTGSATRKIIAGASRIVTLTGDFDLAAGSAETLARTASATGAELSDLAGVAAALSQNLKIRPDELETALDALVRQGKDGAVELKDLASLLPGLTASFGAMSPTLNRGTKGLHELGAAMQIVRRSVGEPAEAATALNALFTALQKNAKRFKGVKIFEKDPETGMQRVRNLSVLLDEIANSKLAKRKTRLIDAFGRQEAFKAFTALTTFRDDFNELKQAGADAAGTIETDFRRFSDSSSGRIEGAMNRIKVSIADAFTPERIERVADAAETFADVLGWAIDHSRELMTIWAAAKVASISGAVMRWGQAAQGVAGATGLAAGHMGGISRSAGALPGKFAAAAGKAGMIVGTMLAAFEAGVALREVLGIEDDRFKTGVQRQRKLVSGLEEKRANLADRVTAQQAHLAGVEETDETRRAFEMMRKDVEDLRALEGELGFERSAESAISGQAEIEKLAKTRPQALDEVLADARRRLAATEAQARLGAGLGGAVEADEISQRFAPKIAATSDTDALRMIVRLLEQQLAEQKRERDLAQRVQSDAFSSRGAPAPARAPAGRRPR